MKYKVNCKLQKKCLYVIGACVLNVLFAMAHKFHSIWVRYDFFVLISYTQWEYIFINKSCYVPYITIKIKTKRDQIQCSHVKQILHYNSKLCTAISMLCAQGVCIWEKLWTSKENQPLRPIKPNAMKPKGETLSALFKHSIYYFVFIRFTIVCSITWHSLKKWRWLKKTWLLNWKLKDSHWSSSSSCLVRESTDLL